MDILNPKKCQTCPYKLGLVKPKLDPCIDCMMSKRKTHPFGTIAPTTVITFCPKCGGKIIVNGRCVLCGAKIK